MQIKEAKPPVWETVEKLFGVKETDPIFYTYGDTIFSPSGKMPSDDLIRHEECHRDQQRGEPEVWWNHYAIDPAWRVEQEADAFGEQLRFLRTRMKDRNALARITHQMAASLASPMYGSAIAYVDAMRKIEAFADGSVISEIENLMPETDPES